MSRTYTTVQGDLWDSIAFAQLGDAGLSDRLMKANLQYRAYYTFPAGVVLTLPEIERKADPSLPPWKRAR